MADNRKVQKKSVQKPLPKPKPKEAKVNLTVEAYTLAKMIVAGCVVRNTRKYLTVKPGEPLKRDKAAEVMVADVLREMSMAMKQEVFRQLGWEG